MTNFQIFDACRELVMFLAFYVNTCYGFLEIHEDIAVCTGSSLAIVGKIKIFRFFIYHVCCGELHLDVFFSYIVWLKILNKGKQSE